VLMESLTYRYEGHGMSDKSFQNQVEELEHYKELDPITKLRDTLCAKYKEIGPTLEKLETKADETVAEAEKFAEESPAPTYEDLINHIYA
jgi:pyruvate dehydrogenase E1 component subunit alpha